jgi:hypothetical protein
LGLRVIFTFWLGIRNAKKTQHNWSSLKVSLSSEMLFISRWINNNFNIKISIDTWVTRTIISTMLNFQYFAPFSRGAQKCDMVHLWWNLTFSTQNLVTYFFPTYYYIIVKTYKIHRVIQSTVAIVHVHRYYGTCSTVLLCICTQCYL